MSASLVGSEMCIRDRPRCMAPARPSNKTRCPQEVIAVLLQTMCFKEASNVHVAGQARSPLA
eukprot:500325-Alexandrium_andersonii.AAC.1